MDYIHNFVFQWLSLLLLLGSNSFTGENLEGYLSWTIVTKLLKGQDEVKLEDFTRKYKNLVVSRKYKHLVVLKPFIV